jgi:diguanylate cyclase (GGDEF)-like protein
MEILLRRREPPAPKHFTDVIEMLNATTQRLPRPLVAAAVAFLLAAIFAAGMIWHLESLRLQEERARVAVAVSGHAQTLQYNVERALSATYALAALVRQGNGTVANFEIVANQMLPFYPGVAALALAPKGVVRSIVPLAGNEQSVGHDMLHDPARAKESMRARDSGLLTLAGPFNLVQGGLGAVARLPVFFDGAGGNKNFWGFTTVLLRFPEALSHAQLTQLSGQHLAYELWRIHPDTGKKQIITASQTTALVDPLEQNLDVGNTTWTLSVAPMRGWNDPLGLSFKAALGMLFSLLLAYIVKLLAEQRLYKQGLEALVALRTAEIQASRHQLQATIDAIPDMMWELGLDGVFHSCHCPRTDLLVAPSIGTTVSDSFPPEVAAVIMAALLEAHETGGSVGRHYQQQLAHDKAWFELSVSSKSTDSGQAPRFIVLARDISQSKAAEEHILRLGHFDPLTGLANRILLNDRINHAISMAQRSRTQLAVLFFDLDHFKHVNDSLGHSVGDKLLIEIATRLKLSVRDQDTVSRLGGDEFILVLPDTDANGAAHVAEKLLETVAQVFWIDQYELVVTPSIGIAVYPGDGADYDTLFKCADAAMYRAKQDGRNHFRFFTAEMQARSARALQLETALRSALKRNQLMLHFQPQVSLEDGRVIGAEALLRWRHPEFGMISPAEFIPIAEDCGQILSIGEWVLRSAARQLREWMDRGLSPMTMAVNLSAVQFRHPSLPEMVTKILDEVELAPQYLELELTESVAMDNPLGAIAVMDNLHERGIRMSIDDFGTGYSSLSYLKRFKVYKLKIDQSFVRDITDDQENKVIVGAIITLAKSLGLQTIAEGVETKGQIAFLHDNGCDELQGYYFSKPLPAEQFEAFVRGCCG